MTESDHLPTLLEELTKTVQEKGSQAVIALLRNSRSKVSNDADIQFVILSVCNQMSVNIDFLLTKQSSDDGTKYAKGFIVYYLREYFDIDWKIIMDILKHKDQSYLWRLMKNIKTIKKYLSAQKEFFDHKVLLDTQIKNYIQNNK